MKASVHDAGDAQIIREVLSGDVDAFAPLLERYGSHVAGIVARHVPRDRVPETVHETFVRAFQSLRTYGGKRPFKHWLTRIALRCCYDLLRELYRNRERPFSSLSREDRAWMQRLPAEGSDEAFAAHARRTEAARLLAWALDHLSAGDRMALCLTALEGYTAAEAAEMLGWSIANVKVRAFRARRKLRHLLSSVEQGVNKEREG